MRLRVNATTNLRPKSGPSNKYTAGRNNMKNVWVPSTEDQKKYWSRNGIFTRSCAGKVSVSLKPQQGHILGEMPKIWSAHQHIQWLSPSKPTPKLGVLVGKLPSPTWPQVSLHVIQEMNPRHLVYIIKQRTKSEKKLKNTYITNNLQLISQ